MSLPTMLNRIFLNIYFSKYLLNPHSLQHLMHLLGYWRRKFSIVNDITMRDFKKKYIFVFKIFVQFEKWKSFVYLYSSLILKKCVPLEHLYVCFSVYFVPDIYLTIINHINVLRVLSYWNCEWNKLNWIEHLLNWAQRQSKT